MGSDQTIKRLTVVEQVMQKMKGLIADGVFKEGDKLPSENELAEQFGIGRSSVREAVKIFTYMGVLKSYPAKGTFVSNRENISTEAVEWALLLGKQKLFELLEIRAAIELWSITKMADNYSTHTDSTEEKIKKLDLIVEAMETDLREDDREDLVNKDYEFHKIIVSNSENQLFISIYELLHSFTKKEISWAHQTWKDNVPQTHRNLINAIVTGDPQIAMETYRNHIEETKKSLK